VEWLTRLAKMAEDASGAAAPEYALTAPELGAYGHVARTARKAGSGDDSFSAIIAH
jgi:hypothetical protein